jgi:hypothetical protein
LVMLRTSGAAARMRSMSFQSRAGRSIECLNPL